MAIPPATDGRLVGSDRVLAVLVELAQHPAGIGLDELTTTIGSAKSTVHRALGALVRAGLATKDGRGTYRLGDEFFRIAFSHREARPDHERVTPALQALCERFAETVHFAVLDDRSVVYQAKVDPPAGAVRLTSTVGGRNPAHVTAVGKLLLAYRLPDLESVQAWTDAAPVEPRTPNSLTSATALHAELEQIRARGYAVDDEESELGVACVALPTFLASPSTPSGAVSVSALARRTPLQRLVAAIDEIRDELAAFGISTTPDGARSH
ncbi:IclR family transcriptional regulator [Ruania alba]|uniref:DNA-binding transcriptional regulator, IclR family n=1 Tax=Ruania alba TaxID=648782 RepID=A0A1H5CYM1_9MICO|nr:IclR family transcriptional regulator [Ruania alba]SED71775.1 DNA-binding transcriptional regulator, IclR family [Ruania alba]